MNRIKPQTEQIGTMLRIIWSVTSIVQVEENGRKAHLRVIEDETGAGVYGRGSRVRCRVWLLTSVKLEGLELGFPV